MITITITVIIVMLRITITITIAGDQGLTVSVVINTALQEEVCDHHSVQTNILTCK